MATVNGTTAAGHLKGTATADSISGFAGDDKLKDLAGIDIPEVGPRPYELISATKHGAYLPRRLQGADSLSAALPVDRTSVKPPHAI